MLCVKKREAEAREQRRKLEAYLRLWFVTRPSISIWTTGFRENRSSRLWKGVPHCVTQEHSAGTSNSFGKARAFVFRSWKYFISPGD
jgi:hypothetical protein